jgi:hypothetical protein
MWGSIKSRLSYANVMATIALFVALGGGAYALTAASAVQWNQRGRPAVPGQPGPRAVKLYFDRTPDVQLVTLGSVGPCTIKPQCGPGSASVPGPVRLIADGPGSADLTYTDRLNDGTLFTQQQHTDLTTDDTLFSFGDKTGGADRDADLPQTVSEY